MTENHYCHHYGHKEMVPVWTDGTNMARITAWICIDCCYYEGLRPGEETITRGEHESGRLRE